MKFIDLWGRFRGRGNGLRADVAVPLQSSWSYVQSRIGYYSRYLRLGAIGRRRPFPASQMLSQPFPAERWCLYFMYLPEGQVSSAHRYTIGRIRAGGTRLLAVVAARDRESAAEVGRLTGADAVIWKALSGFDFSGYSLGIDAIAQHSPGASLLVLNDSVLGPFVDVDALVAETPWDLTGFTASIRIENHIQSYAFHLKSVMPETSKALRPVLSDHYVYERYVDVIYCQETRLARVASRHMSVGSLWYSADPLGDPGHEAALSLMDRGFPFLKRKLLLEHHHLYPDGALEALLQEHGHSLPDASWRA